jgi:predicted unusual protein kinase regulating ubiquinone biosynthesis (AarF/ABC1/UbiB family)
MLSIQEEDLIPAEIRQQFERARNSASMMPNSQLQMMMQDQLGTDWRQKFKLFEELPFAAASIG